MLFSDEFAVFHLQCRITILLILLVSLLSFSFQSLCMKGTGKLLLLLYLFRNMHKYKDIWAGDV